MTATVKVPKPHTSHARQGWAEWRDEIRHTLLDTLVGRFEPYDGGMLGPVTPRIVRRREWWAIWRAVWSWALLAVLCGLALGALSTGAVVAPWGVTTGVLLAAALAVFVFWRLRIAARTTELILTEELPVDPDATQEFPIYLQDKENWT